MYYALTINEKEIITGIHQSQKPFTKVFYDENPEFKGQTLRRIESPGEYVVGLSIKAFESDGRLRWHIDLIREGLTPCPQGYRLEGDELVEINPDPNSPYKGVFAKLSEAYDKIASLEDVGSKTEALQQEIKRLKDESKALKDEVEERRQEAEAINDRYLSLTFPPPKGEEWRADRDYLKGDNISENKAEYEALKFSRGKRPSENPNYWRKKEPAVPHEPDEEIKEWSAFTDGAWLKSGEIYKHKGKCWKCLRSHKKHIIWEPSENSIYWEEVK